MIHASAADFSFATDAEARDYFVRIAEIMMISFGITREEAFGRINESWSHVAEVNSEDAELFRELPPYWANHFYHGHASLWWIPPAQREKMGLPPLAPLPYPKEGRS